MAKTWAGSEPVAPRCCAVAITAGDWATLAAKNDALSDLIFYLED